MFGMDLLGVEPNSIFSEKSKEINGNIIYPSNPTAANIADRKGPYLDRTNIGAFKPAEVFSKISGSVGTYLEPNRMICDTFATQSTIINGKRYKIGMPVLYFRANPSAENTQLIPTSSWPGYHALNIYNYMDNFNVIAAAHLNNSNNSNFFSTADGTNFYNYISDPMIPAVAGALGRPVHPDSFILISAGPDGIYGTKDDICNFEPNIK
jgi:hypothetical protein